MESPQSRILFVDDDVRLLSMLESLMGEYAAGRWHIKTASDSATALSILQAGAMDLVVVDVHLPVVDGIQFLRLLQSRFSGMAKVILTGDATAAHRQASLESGADLYLEKPRSAAGWQSVFTALDQVTRLRTGESGFRGMLRRVELQDILQMECLARSSSVLEISAGAGSGRIYLREGNFVHAEIGDKTGEDAFNAILGFSRGEFCLHPYTEPLKRTLEGPWEFLLMEAARKRDETAGAAPATDPDQGTAMIELARAVLAPTAMVAPAPLAHPAMPESVAKMPRIDEVLVCSTHGDVWYEWQSNRPETRLQLMTLLRHKAKQMTEGLPLGPVDELEISGSASRFLIQLRPDCCLLVRSSRVACPTAQDQAP